MDDDLQTGTMDRDWLRALFDLWQQPDHATDLDVAFGAFYTDPVIVNGRIYQLLVWLNGALPRSLARWVAGLAGRRYRKT